MVFLLMTSGRNIGDYFLLFQRFSLFLSALLNQSQISHDIISRRTLKVTLCDLQSRPRDPTRTPTLKY